MWATTARSGLLRSPFRVARIAPRRVSFDRDAEFVEFVSDQMDRTVRVATGTRGVQQAEKYILNVGLIDWQQLHVKFG